MRRHIPNIITLMNLLCGSAAVILSLWGFYFPAWLFIIAAAAFDFLDGFSARLLGAYSEVGKQLDSLSDLISFGLAPSVMFFSIYYHGGHSCSALAFVSLIIVAFSALRLAKFNVDSRQSVDFIGLPTPANAMIIASLAAYYDVCVRYGAGIAGLGAGAGAGAGAAAGAGVGAAGVGAGLSIGISSGVVCGLQQSGYAGGVVCKLFDSGWFIPLVSVILSLFLVCELPMFSLKKKRLNFRESPLVMTFLVVTAAIVLCGELFYPHKTVAIGNFPLWIALSFSFYIILNLIAAPFAKSKSNNQ